MIKNEIAFVVLFMRTSFTPDPAPTRALFHNRTLKRFPMAIKANFKTQ